MANYTPEVEARIKELEDELATLRKSKYTMAPTSKTKDLRKITKISSSMYDQRIVWLAKAATAAVDFDGYFNNVKTAKNMTYEETVRAFECASKIADVLLEYARKNYCAQEVQDDG